MAHVLLPCDLPNWAELQRQLSQIRLAQTAAQLTEDMLKIYDSCSVNLDPEEFPPLGDPTRYAGLCNYINGNLNDSERVHFFKAILPSLVSNAQRLTIVRPQIPFVFSLQQEEKVTRLERRFLASILANALFSTFPSRTIKTHPTLQNFNFGEFFRYMEKASQREKLKYILKYFEKISVIDPKGTIRFCRHVFPESSIPSMPSWLCNTKPLCQIAVRQYGNIEDSEPEMIKVCFCSRRIGGRTLLEDDSQESMMFSRFPELLTTLCFVEALQDNEALLIQGICVLERLGDSTMPFLDGHKEADVILMDALDFSDDVNRQYEDKYLMRDLTKLLVSFSQPHSIRRPSPIGESSGSSTCPDRRSPATGANSPVVCSRRSSDQSMGKRHKVPGNSGSDSQESDQKGMHTNKTEIATKGPNKQPPKIKPPELPSFKERKSADVPILSRSSSNARNLTKKQSGDLRHKESPSRRASLLKRENSNQKASLNQKSSLFSTGRKASLTKIAPKRHVMNQTSGEEEYYTADESIDSCEEIWFLPGLGQKNSPSEDENYSPSNLDPVTLSLLNHANRMNRYTRLSEGSSSQSSLEKFKGSSRGQSRSKSSSPHKLEGHHREFRGICRSRSTGSVSRGMALRDGSEEEDDDSLNLSEFERYEDFRKRFRRRSRGLSRRRSSRHSRTSSSGSSEMEDIEEDPELLFGTGPVMRSANSEPSLVAVGADSNTMQLANILAVPADTFIMARRGRKLVMTTGDGQLKAYSYDGVHPNLPVPFKAKFRQRRNSTDEAVCDLRTNGRHFYSQANAGFWRKVEAEARIGVTSGSSSQDEDKESGNSGDERLRGRKSRSARGSNYSNEDPRLLQEEEEYCSILRSSADGLRPVATGRWGCGRLKGDPQLRAVLQWLAASNAGLPYLIYYTKGDPYLEKLEELSKLADLKQWTVGHVACEALRYCRNRLSLHKSGTSSQHPAQFLFTMLIGQNQPLILRQHESLD